MMNEINKAQVYVKSSGDSTSVVVASGDKLYFHDVLNVPEITGIQRGVSFVKNQLDADVTEIYPDKLEKYDILKDAYINYCNINPCIGEEPNKDMIKLCKMKLQQEKRWNTRGGRE